MNKLLESISFRNKWQKFMLESNQIEGEDRLNPRDKEVFIMAISGITTEDYLLVIHKMLTEHLDVNWSGKYRTINVRVGDYVAPDFKKVPELMTLFLENLSKMDSWETHNEFMNIHPFQDFNGRTGRLMWLSKAIDEGYNFSISFKHHYYYQTLRHQNRII